MAPNPAHLFLLLTIADVMGLRDGILMRPDRGPARRGGPGGCAGNETERIGDLQAKEEGL